MRVGLCGVVRGDALEDVVEPLVVHADDEWHAARGGRGNGNIDKVRVFGLAFCPVDWLEAAGWRRQEDGVDVAEDGRVHSGDAQGSNESLVLFDFPVYSLKTERAARKYGGGKAELSSDFCREGC